MYEHETPPTNLVILISMFQCTSSLQVLQVMDEYSYE
jgi:hypothetical protein